MSVGPAHRFKFFSLLTLLLLFFAAPASLVRAQSGTFAIWGEIKINGDPSDPNVPASVDVILVKIGTGEIARQGTSNRGRYRFTNLSEGEYEIVVEANAREITRARLQIFERTPAPFYGFRQDFEFEWKSNAGPSPKNDVISAADVYQRSPANQAVFHKAQAAVTKKDYDGSITLLRQILDNDPKDFQVWRLLGTIYQVQRKNDDAERAYLQAIQAKPDFALALLDLGTLRASLKHYDQAIAPLLRAVEIQPESAEANLYVGEVYLQLKQGSKAVPYLTEAAKLGRIEGYLRLGWLYDAAGIKDKAAAEYEELLKKNPEYADRKKLEEYISANKVKKPTE
ncbi:MAG TPA: tetratricopeptide repeat protein [Pyrinomonadaceae bacterium]|nr:tetratricopeptide repeat protein [Pyrinomonadaceae bacterium]